MSTTLVASETPAPGSAAPLPVAAPAAPAPRPAHRLVLVYLAVMLPVLFLDAEGATPWGTVAAHLAALAAVVWALRARPGNLAAEWLPLLLTPFFYAELPALIAGLNPPGYRDATVQGWEQALFGFQPARELAGMFPWLWLSELLHAGYLSYYLMIFGPPAALYLRGRREEFAGSQLAVLATFVVCYLGFVLLPVEGPRYAWPAPEGIPEGPLYRLARVLLEGGSSRGTAFPSSHAAVAVAASVAALRYQWRVGVAVSTASILLVAGAVYGGYHYAVDMAVGVVVGLAVAVPVLAAFERRRARV